MRFYFKCSIAAIAIVPVIFARNFSSVFTKDFSASVVKCRHARICIILEVIIMTQRLQEFIVRIEPNFFCSRSFCFQSGFIIILDVCIRAGSNNLICRQCNCFAAAVCAGAGDSTVSRAGRCRNRNSIQIEHVAGCINHGRGLSVTAFAAEAIEITVFGAGSRLFLQSAVVCPSVAGCRDRFRTRHAAFATNKVVDAIRGASSFNVRFRRISYPRMGVRVGVATAADDYEHDRSNNGQCQNHQEFGNPRTKMFLHLVHNSF